MLHCAANTSAGSCNLSALTMRGRRHAPQDGTPSMALAHGVDASHEMAINSLGATSTLGFLLSDQIGRVAP
jgi:hypothetical protein